MTYNLYTIDLLTLLVHKFIYAGNIRCATQAEIFADLECTLTADLAWLTQYCQQWRLKPSVSKTVASVFHLCNTSANHQLNILMIGQRLAFDPEPVYLGVTLDRTLSFKAHLQKTFAKLNNRNNLLSKLAGTTWNVQASTLRTSALALC